MTLRMVYSLESRVESSSSAAAGHHELHSLFELGSLACVSELRWAVGILSAITRTFTGSCSHEKSVLPEVLPMLAKSG